MTKAQSHQEPWGVSVGRPAPVGLQAWPNGQKGHNSHSWLNTCSRRRGPGYKRGQERQMHHASLAQVRACLAQEGPDTTSLWGPRLAPAGIDATNTSTHPWGMGGSGLRVGPISRAQPADDDDNGHDHNDGNDDQHFKLRNVQQ